MELTDREFINIIKETMALDKKREIEYTTTLNGYIHFLNKEVIQKNNKEIDIKNEIINSLNDKVTSTQKLIYMQKLHSIKTVIMMYRIMLMAC